MRRHPGTLRRMRWWFPVVFLGILVLSSWLIWGGGWQEAFSLEGGVSRLQGAGDWAWALGIGLLVADLVLPVPGTIIMSALGFLYGPWLGGLIAAAGSMAAGVSGFLIGRLFGERLIRRWLGDREFERGTALFRSQGGWMVAISRALPILPEVLACSAGVMRMGFRPFCLALAAGSVPMGFAFASIGALGHSAPQSALVLSLGIPGLLWFGGQYLLRRFGKR